jgi:hypothetical protein
VKAWIERRGHGPVEIRPGKSGQFDVVIGDHVAYSRYDTRGFPSDADLEALRF